MADAGPQWGRPTEEESPMALAQHTTVIRTATRADREPIASVLSVAFQEDPAFRWVIPDAERRRRVLPAFFGLFFDAFARHGENRVAPGLPQISGVAGAALWAPPGPPIADEDVEAFSAGLAALAGVDAGRLSEIDRLLAEQHPEEPCWYLQFAGVDPAFQGRGIGSALMAPVLQHCDDVGLPAYLDATSPRNRRLYERHGFEVVGEIQLPGGPPLWSMWREPYGSVSTVQVVGDSGA
jgi:GNAT superfamily N-acetyltransferase